MTTSDAGVIVDEKLYFSTLELLERSDRALARAPDIGLTEPHRIDDVTPAFVESVIGEPFGAKLIEMTRIDGHNGMTDRGKWSLEWDSAGRAAALPGAIFAKATPTLMSHRERMSVNHLDENEVNFYTRLASEFGNVVPKCYFAAAYGGGRSLILLEDLVERGCTPYWQAYDCTVDHARAVLLAQAKYHAKFWESERLTGDLAWVRPRAHRIGMFRSPQERAKLRMTFLASVGEDLVPPDVAEVIRIWDAAMPTVLSHWDAQQRTFIHGDSHLGNTFSNPDGSAGYFDWQCFCIGPALRDAACFVMSALHENDRKTHERSLFDEYLDALESGGVKLDRERAWNDYCLFVIDRWDTTASSYLIGTYNHGREGQLRIFRTIAGSIRDNDIGGRLKTLLRAS